MRAQPRPTPETAPFWEGTAAGELRIQRCGTCEAAYFPPQPFCPGCGSDDVTWLVASGRATLLSYVVAHRPMPGFDPPYVIAVVALAEGPNLVTNLVGIDADPDLLDLDMALEAVFVDIGDHTLVCFGVASTP